MDNDKLLHEKKLKQLYHRMGLKHNMTDEDLKILVNSPYEFSREKIRNLKLEGEFGESEFDKLKTNFMYRYLGKFYIEYRRILYERRKKKLREERRGEDS